MKKCCCFLIWLVLFTSLTFASASADLPTINSVLASGFPADKVEVYNELNDYNFLNDNFDEYEYDFKFIILQRESPDKEFTAKMVYPPFDNPDGFDEDFNGIDKGEPRIWLRGDLMQQLLPENRAQSMRDATYLLIGETYYEWGGTLTYTDYEEATEDELPEFGDTEEMLAYFAAHPKKVTSMTYHPKFAAYTIITIYETATKRSNLLGYTFNPAMRFGKNPEASDQWYNMEDIAALLELLEATGNQTDRQTFESMLESIEFVPQGKKDLWKSCFDAGEATTAYHSISDYFWLMAEELKNLDPSETNRSNYDLIIREKDRTALDLFVNYCNYSGFDRPLASIEQTRDYMAKPDYDWMEQELQEIVDIFK